MHVLQVAFEHPPRVYGGLGRHVGGLVDGLAGSGVQVTVLTPELHGPEGRQPEGVRVLRAGPPAVALPGDRWVAATVDAGVRMAQLALRSAVAPDVLHVHDWMAGHAAAVLAPALGVPVVVTVHATERGRHQGHLPPGISAWIDAQERALVELADHVVVCADHVRDHVVAHLGATASRTTVIPNGVDVTAWRDGPTRPRGTQPRVVFAGRLEHEKGLHVLLEAVEGMARPVEVVVAGRGSQGPALRRRAGRGVRFDGHLDQPDLAALLRSADVAVVPSLYEPFGLAALEAMAAGAPVIASRTGGLARTVAEGAGVLVPPGDAAALRDALVGLLDDPARRRQLVDGGRRQAASMTWSAAARQVAQVYEGVRRW